MARMDEIETLEEPEPRSIEILLYRITDFNGCPRVRLRTTARMVGMSMPLCADAIYSEDMWVSPTIGGPIPSGIQEMLEVMRQVPVGHSRRVTVTQGEDGPLWHS